MMSRLQSYQNVKAFQKKESVKKMHQQKCTKQAEMKMGLLYKPLIKKPSKKVLAKSVKMETERKKSLKKVLKNTQSEKFKKQTNKKKSTTTPTSVQQNQPTSMKGPNFEGDSDYA